MRFYFWIFIFLIFFYSCRGDSNSNILDELKNSEAVVRSIQDASKIKIKTKWSGNSCHFKLKNRGEHDVQIQEIILFTLNHDLPFSTPMYGEGFTMLSQTGGTLGKSIDIGHYSDAIHYKIPEPEDATTVYNLLKLKYPSGEYGLMAFASSNRFVGKFYIRKGQIQVSLDAENLLLKSGESWVLEEFFYIQGKDQAKLLSKLAEKINSNHPRLDFSAPPTGWCSWYSFGPGVRAVDIANNLNSIRNYNLDLKYIQIDDGYQSAMGDWLITNDKFGMPVEGLLVNIKNSGFEPAIWVAPFIAEEKSAVFKNHPQWFVKDQNGSPLRSDKVSFGGWRNGPWYVLDGTHPEVQEHFKKVFSTMKEKWGCSYFKLDANFWGAIHGGKFFDENATRVEAYRKGMQAILEATGDGFVLGCNHPIWPSLGLIHGSRTSMDVVRSWDNFSKIAKENLMRNWMNNTLWHNDPDCIVLNGGLSMDEFLFHATTIYATGGMLLSGDDLSKLSDDKLDILKQVLPPSGNPFSFANDKLEIGELDKKQGFELCFLNWSDRGQRYAKKIDGNYLVLDKFSKEEMGIFSSEISLRLRPHSGKILVCTPIE